MDVYSFEQIKVLIKLFSLNLLMILSIFCYHTHMNLHI